MFHSHRAGWSWQEYCRALTCLQSWWCCTTRSCLAWQLLVLLRQSWWRLLLSSPDGVCAVRHDLVLNGRKRWHSPALVNFWIIVVMIFHFQVKCDRLSSHVYKSNQQPRELFIVYYNCEYHTIFAISVLCGCVSVVISYCKYFLPIYLESRRPQLAQELHYPFPFIFSALLLTKFWNLYFTCKI